jgi:putative spermidine/putrescine transport system ATP-binding protein
VSASRAANGKSIALRRVVKRFGAVAAADGVTLDVAPGEFCTLLGPSGSGKTTVLKLIAGFEATDEGEIHIAGRDMAAVAAFRRNIGVVFQNYALFPHMTVGQNIAFPLEMRRHGRAEREAAVERALALVDLADLGARYPRQLSGGQQQRVALARALVFNPDILLMDEPLGALDKNLRQAIQLELKALHRKLGVTVVYVTHDQEEAIFLSDRIVVLSKGRIAQAGSAEDLYERPSTRFVATFLGDCNLFDGRVAGLEPGRVAIDLDDGGRMALAAKADGLAVGRKVTLGCRPERTRLAAAGTEHGIAATVIEAAYLGATRKLILDTGAKRIIAVTDAAANLAAIGAKVRVVLDPERTVLLGD